MGNAGNEKQAGQKKGAAELRTLIAQLLGVVELAECENCETAYGDDDPERCAECECVYAAVLDAREAMKDPPPPPSAEKLALRGEPTARTLIANLLLAMDDKLPCLQLVEVFAAARAYLSTRAPAEEALIEANREWAAAERAMRDLQDARDRGDFDRPLREFTPANERLRAAIGVRDDCAFALPVEGRAPRTLIVGASDSPHEKLIREGRAPDASHEKKLGKKGGGS